jgi:hypothetical protein
MVGLVGVADLAVEVASAAVAAGLVGAEHPGDGDEY